jgi:hypothetical protein
VYSVGGQLFHVIPVNGFFCQWAKRKSFALLRMTQQFNVNGYMFAAGAIFKNYAIFLEAEKI